MKKTLLGALLSCWCLLSFAQSDIVITEISYNPPESGTDTTEYIELYNNGVAAINLQGYTFTDGVTYTFPSLMIMPGNYVVVAVDSVAMFNRFGITARQWTSGGLSNSGEDIVIEDGLGNLVDSVDFDDNSPWPTGPPDPDGSGPSIVLCDPNADNNDPANWQISTDTLVGAIINGSQVFGSPGAADAGCVAAPMAGIPTYTISQVNTVDANGVTDSLNVECNLEGIVVGIDNDGNNGYSFTLMDDLGGTTNGINVFSFVDVNGYVVTEGDEISVYGEIGQFNGLTQIVPDSIFVLSTGNQLPDTVMVTIPDESTESRLIRIDSVWIVDANQWPGANSSANVDVTNGTDTITFRIDGDNNVADSIPVAPADTFTLYGIGGQFDFSSPFTEGYQIQPRYYTDVVSGGGATPPPPAGGIPTYPIAQVNTVDVNGVSDSLNVECNLLGIVIGIDNDGNNGFSFTIMDTIGGTTNGINVFSFVDVSNYVVTEGDEISVYGTIDQFSGLTEIVPDSIFVLSTGNQLPDTVTVTVPTEMTESRLIHVEDYWVVDPAQWPSANASANIDLTNGTDTITMRIDGDNNVADSIPVAPADTFDVYGIGGQFDNSNPFTEGYQILPRYYTDIVSGSQVAPPPVVSIPSYTIAQVHTEDADGVADSLNVTCKLTGIVYGIDNRGGNGYSFTIIDNTGGMNVFSFNDVDNYVVQEGDEIRVIGSIDQFNGLTEIIPDSIVLISTGNALKAPVVVTTLMEANESDFLRIEGVRVIDPSQWPSGSSSNVQLETPCGDTVVMRIDSDTDVELNIPSAPTVPFTLTGIGGQFDNSSPFTEGYQIFPRFFTDIDTTLPAGEQLFINELMSNNVVTVADGSGDFDDWIELYNPNGTAVDIANYTISDDLNDPAKFRFDGCDPATEIPASDFSLVWADNEVSEGALHVNFELDEANGGWIGLWGPDGQLIDSLSYPALDADDSYGRETDGASSFVIFTINPTPDAPNMISSTGDDLSAIGNTLIVYPNPAGNEVVNLNQKADINVVNLLGQPVMTGRQVNQIDVTDWESGVYFIRTEDGRTAKLVIR